MEGSLDQLARKLTVCVFLNARTHAAAQFEQGDYDGAIKTEDDAVEKGRELRADYKIIAK